MKSAPLGIEYWVAKKSENSSGFTIAAIVLISLGMFSIWSPEADRPLPTIEPPTVALQKVVAPITEVLNGYPEQASILKEFYFEASETIRRDGQGEKVIQTKSNLRTFCKRSATLRFQGMFEKVHGLADVTFGNDGALSLVLGLKPGQLDHEKAADAFYAVAWACQEAQ